MMCAFSADTEAAAILITTITRLILTCTSAGTGISEPVDHGWRRRNIRRHLDTKYFRAGGLSGIEYEDARARVRVVGRASRPIEIKLDHVENWDINAPQTEEEAGESPESLSLEIDDCRNLTIANYHGYRVTRSRAPFPAAVRIYRSSNIHFRNVHVNAESGYGICDANGCGTFLRLSKFPYENAIEDMTHHLEVREREFAALEFRLIHRSRSRAMRPLCWIKGTTVKKAGGRLLLDFRALRWMRGQALFRGPPRTSASTGGPKRKG